MDELVNAGFLVPARVTPSGDVVPLWTLEYLKSQGYSCAGDRVKAIYSHMPDLPKDTVTVKHCIVEGWTSFYEFEELPGLYNAEFFNNESSISVRGRQDIRHSRGGSGA